MSEMMMMDIDIEEIDDNSSQEDCPPATTAATKKRAKNKNRSKKESPAVASSTLTRFLGPSGPPSLSAWEDVNRQCPVCQQTGFSSRSLALHVNECLDVGSSTGAGARAGAGAADCEGESEAAGAKETQRVKKGAGTAARTRNAPTAVSTRTVGNAGLSNASHAAGSGSGEGVARKVPLAVPSKSKAPVSNGQAAKKAKTQQDGRGAAAERKRPEDSTRTAFQGCGQATDKARSGARSLRPSLLDSDQSPAGVAQRQQPTPLRRRGLGLARPTRGQPTGSDAAPTPTAAVAAAVSRAPNGGDERALNEIARAQLSYVLEASASSSASQGGGWLSTRLFPKPSAEDSLTDDQCGDCCCDGASGGQGACVASLGANADASACAASRGGGRNFAANETSNGNSRVRARPASWGARPSSEQRGWLGIWPSGIDDDDDNCWGDGDGYLTLRPFPSVAEQPTTGVDAEDASATQSLSSPKAQGCSPASTSRADRFLEVFARLQPARRALNLHESPPPSPKARPEPKESEAKCGGVEGAGAQLPPRAAAAAGDIDHDPNRDGKQDVASPGPKESMAASPAGGCGGGGAKAKAEVGGTASRCEVGSVGKLATLLPKRATIQTLRSPSAGASSTVDQRSSANIDIVPGRSRAAPPSSPAHYNSLGPASTPVNTSVNAPVNNESRKVPPNPPSCTPAVPPASEVGKSCGNGYLASNPLANAKGSVTEKSPPEAAASVPPTSHVPGVTSAEKVATGASEHPKPAAVARTQVKTPACAGGKPPPPPRNGSTGASGRMIGRLAGASVAVKRDRASTARESEKWADQGGDPQVQLATPVSRRWGGSRSRGPLAHRASSGLLRSAECGAASASRVAEPELAPAASARFMDPAASATSQQEQGRGQEACPGRKADVPQKGSLTVVCDHGATLRDSWSIDDSQEVGRLVFGASLGYDTVWYLDPADGDCIGVLRYRILPQPTLAPTGGWISERGRLREDPYTIVKATPSPTSTSSSSSSASSSLSPRTASSSDRQRRREVGETQASLGRHGSATPHHQKQQQHRQQDILRNEGLAQSVSTQRSDTNAGRARGSSRYPSGGSHGERSAAPAAATTASSVSSSSSKVEGGRRAQPKSQTRTQTQAGSKVFGSPGAAPSPSPGRGGFGIATNLSPPAKALETTDTGDKVTCPVCNRGMDHWKSGQRQQHVHACLLKQSSSAKKAPPPAPTAVTPVPRAPGKDKNRSLGKRAHSGVEETGPSARGQGGREWTGPAESTGTDSPRSTRVSLQGVFSPKPARGPRGAGRGPSQPEHRRDSSSRGPSASAESPRQEAVTPTPTPTRKNGASRGMAQARVPANKSTVAQKAKAPAECPVCQLHFGGRLGDWERQQHIQQCLESLEGVFDSAE